MIGARRFFFYTRTGDFGAVLVARFDFSSPSGEGFSRAPATWREGNFCQKCFTFKDFEEKSSKTTTGWEPLNGGENSKGIPQNHRNTQV